MRPTQRGGAGRGQGRKPSEPTVTTSIRLTPARRDKLRRLGSKWLAAAIDSATLTNKE